MLTKLVKGLHTLFCLNLTEGFIAYTRLTNTKAGVTQGQLHVTSEKKAPQLRK